MQVPEGLEVRLFGVPRVLRGGYPVLLPGTAQVALLAALADRRGTSVTADALAAAMWPHDRPDTPVAAVRGHVDRLRAALSTGRRDEAAAREQVTAWVTYEVDVVRTGDGWQLDARPGCVDLERFESDARAGLTSLRAGDHPAAAELLGRACDHVSDPLLDGLGGPFDTRRAEVRARQLEAVIGFADAGLALGLHDEVVLVLDAAASVFPTVPTVWQRLAAAHTARGSTAAAYRVLDRAAQLFGRSPDQAVAQSLRRLRAQLVDLDPAVRLAVAPPSAAPGRAGARGSGHDPGLVTAPAGWRLHPPSVRPPVAAPAAPATVTRFRLFPRLAVLLGGRERDLRTDEQRRLLAALLLRRNTPVPLGDLVAAVWGDDPPMKPRAAVEVQLAELRRAFAPHPLPVGETGGPAWKLTVLPGSVDVDEAATLVEEGRRQRAAGQGEAAADALRGALDLLAGPGLAGLDGAVLHAERARLAAWRAELAWECLAAEVACDRTDRALPDLRDLVARYPLREDLWEWLVLAAARHEGRDAGLAAYDEAARHLRRALGAAPGPALQAVRARVVAGTV